MDSIYSVFNEFLWKFWQQNQKHLFDPPPSSSALSSASFRLPKSFSSNEIDHRKTSPQSSFLQNDKSEECPIERLDSRIPSILIVALKKFLTIPIQIGCYCPSNWANVFDLCKFIGDMENTALHSNRSSLLSRARTSINTILRSNNSFLTGRYTLSSFSSSSRSPANRGNLDPSIHFDHYQNLYSEKSATNPIRNYHNLPGLDEAEFVGFEKQFESILNESQQQSKESFRLISMIDMKDFDKIIEFLIILVGRIFENISLKCNLSVLSAFVQELCDYSHKQLEELNELIISIDLKQSNLHRLHDENVFENTEKKTKLCKTSSSLSSSAFSSSIFDVDAITIGNKIKQIDHYCSEYKSFMLFRLVEIILRFVRNSRPLLHFMKIWPIVSNHLVYASTHRNGFISKKSIISLHDIINAFLSTYSESDYFDFNESLFRPYERLLRHEICNSEYQQELILCSICEFVEGCTKEIRSGWRSIFRALKGLRLTMIDTDYGDYRLESATKFRFNPQDNFGLDDGVGGDPKQDRNESSLKSSSSSSMITIINCSHHLQILIDCFEAFLRIDDLNALIFASSEFLSCIFHLIHIFSSKSAFEIKIKHHNLDQKYLNNQVDGHGSPDRPGKILRLFKDRIESYLFLKISPIVKEMIMKFFYNF